MRTLPRTVCVAVVLVGGAGQLWGQAGKPKPLTGTEDVLFRTWLNQLADAARAPKTKVEAATGLLTRTYPQATQALRQFLEDKENRPAQIAVAEAIASSPVAQERPELIEPLMGMLTGEEASVRAAAAKALSTYKDGGVTKRLVEIVLDEKRDAGIRLVTISALQRILLDVDAIDALVRLVTDRNEAIRDAARLALAEITNIRFEWTARQWQRWWATNKNKPRTAWLADLARSLAQTKTELEAENAALRARLAKSMEDLYAATPDAGKEALLGQMLRDPLADVQLVGMRLAARRVSEGADVSKETRARVRAMVAEGSPKVRKQAVLLVAVLADAEALDVLLAQLEGDNLPELRAAVLTALGRLGDPKALPAVLADLRSTSEETATAAAEALGRIAAAKPLSPEQKQQAARGLVDRYRRIKDLKNGVPLREALLTAMGTVGDEKFVSALQAALGDGSARVRLAAVKGLVQLGQAGSADALRPLAADKDRGVRQAAIVALGKLGGRSQLDTILQRADASVELDATVRQQAWDVAMDILAKADAKTLGEVVDALGKRGASAAEQIKIMEMWVRSLKEANSEELPSAQRKLGMALWGAARPAEAVQYLAAAREALAARKAPSADEVWAEWVGAMLEADDPAGVKTMAGAPGDAALAKAVASLAGRLGKLEEKQNWAGISLLVAQVREHLGKKLTAEQQAELKLDQRYETARLKQQEDDRQRVLKLVPQLVGPDAAAKRAAEDELKALGSRAVPGLLAELKTAVATGKNGEAREKAVFDILRQIAPNLAGLSTYSPAGAKDERIRLIDTWLRGIVSRGET